MSFIETFNNNIKTEDFVKDFSNKFLSYLESKEKALYIVLLLYPDTKFHHKLFCCCENEEDFGTGIYECTGVKDCEYKQLTTLNFVIGDSNGYKNSFYDSHVLSVSKIRNHHLVANLFIRLKKDNFNTNRTLYVEKMCYDNRFSEYNNYYRRYCDLEYFDLDKLYEIKTA